MSRPTDWASDRDKVAIIISLSVTIGMLLGALVAIGL